MNETASACRPARQRFATLTRELGTPLVVADALISNIEAAQPADAAALLGALTNRGEQSLRGRSGAVSIWARAN